MNVLEARKLLRVGVMASPEEVTSAYRKRVYAVHPDRNPGDPRATDKVIRLTEAYNVLKAPLVYPPPRRQRQRVAPSRGPAWDWFHADDGEAVGDPTYKPGTDPLTDLINDLRKTVRNVDPAAANFAVGAALGVMAAFMYYRK